ncbi:formimidoylglutamase [Daejeonella lutea]|uniref:Arginase family enzyme n=1 Tax=Daejeonella lutea TaxID=572036 RepID=A0A1T5D2S6_9SPHI|nr:formimidoylglutamase [Daejeonella lutea]SKB65916.1 Arginase family enzyme [Daejeonella lutea]
MSLSDFLSPVSYVSPKNGFYNSHLGSKLEIYTSDFPVLEENTYDIAIIGVQEDRNAINNSGTALAADHFREKFYALNEGNYTTRIVDLGNIKAGHSVSDTYVAVKLVVSELMKINILPVIIGGGQDLTYPQFLAYEDLEQKIDLLVVDSHFDLDDDSEGVDGTTSQSYLNRILLHQPNYLFNFSNIGYQTYFVNQDSLKVMDKLYFDIHRLGDFANSITISEPIIRNANMISFDLAAIRSSDACANANATPNGFYGEEACQICRYAGMNDKLTSIGFYEFNPAYDQNGQTALLLAQMVWYFVDGFYNRKKEYPLLPKSQYITYRASLKDGSHELVFVKSKKSDRWWMQVPYPSGLSKNERHHLVPCRYEDYQMANAGEMPDLWWRTYQKLI